MRYLSFILLLFLFCFSASAQETLTNDTVISMVKTGLGDTIVIAKIKNSNNKFDTSTEGLNKLLAAKVSENIIAAMIEKDGVDTTKSKEKAEKDAIVEITLSAPENGEISELADKTKVYFYTDDTDARDRMKKELAKYPRLESVDSIDKSEFVLVYGITGVRTIDTFIGPFDQTTGDLYAVTLGKKDAQGKTHVRILYSVRKSRNALADASPAKTTMQKFIKEFKKMRGEK